MKKIKIFLIALVFLCLPSGVKAFGIENYFMNTTVLNNGDFEVEEFFVMNGDYNGYERKINFRNVSAPVFDGGTASFGGSDIYNGDDIVLQSVKGVPLNEVKTDRNNLASTFENIRQNADDFKKVYSASSGDYGKYTLTRKTNGVHIKMFNPRSKVGFYLRYTIKNLGVLHNDVAEIGHNIFTSEMNESIRYFEMLITIPNNQTELRAYAHGPLTGNVKLVSRNQIQLNIASLAAQTSIDTRFIFDKSVLNASTKMTGKEALPKILQFEKGKADEANALREKAREQIEREVMIGKIIFVVQIIWLAGLGGILIFVYKKYDKEYTPMFKGKYYRDFPSDIAPETVGYLMNRKIDTKDLSASILHLVYKKVISYEKVPGKKNDYKFILKSTEGLKLNDAEEAVIKLLFNDKNEITLNEFQRKAKSAYYSFIKNYETWKTKATATAMNENYFENNTGMRTLAVTYVLMGVFGTIFSFSYRRSIAFNVIVLLVGVAAAVYLFTYYKRTVKGNEEYSKWMGLRNFINDFGNFEKRELPQIELWEKYLVYAVSFGLAEKLSKQMQIKVDQYNMDESGYYRNIYTSDYFTSMYVLNHVVNRSVSRAYSSAISARDAANSSNSSSGGYGGGFSSGGGSFGGGGGGGRF